MVYKCSIFERFCLLCDEPCDTRHDLCSDCEAELPWLDSQCTRCAVPLPGHSLLCGDCLRREPAFDQVVAPWRFDFPIDSLIHHFKHRADWPSGRVMAGQLAVHLQHAYAEGLPRPARLLPVPLSRQRQRQRGFNQAQMLVDWLSDLLGIPGDTRLLQRPQDTQAQQQLDANARRRNLRQAFTLRPHGVLPAHLALVDDVMTTGATAEALARLLKAAGAQRVDLYCLARTPKPGD